MAEKQESRYSVRFTDEDSVTLLKCKQDIERLKGKTMTTTEMFRFLVREYVNTLQD